LIILPSIISLLYDYIDLEILNSSVLHLDNPNNAGPIAPAGIDFNRNLIRDISRIASRSNCAGRFLGGSRLAKEGVAIGTFTGLRGFYTMHRLFGHTNDQDINSTLAVTRNSGLSPIVSAANRIQNPGNNFSSSLD
jgi:hypothetical protein